jgi:4-amino-4-deoxy-L-arabinose transferase-like glycosyltransferase
VFILPTLVALVVRVLYYLSVKDDFAFNHLIVNPETYDEWAKALVGAGQGTKESPPFYFAPGYPYFLAGLYRLLGPSLHAAVMVQVLLSTLTVTLLTWIAARLWTQREAWVAGLLAALYGPHVYAAGELLPETLFLFLIALAMAFTLAPGHPRGPRDRAAPAPAPKWFALAGAVWALTIPLRSVVVFAVPIIVLDALRRGGRRAAALAALPMIAVIACFAGINAHHSGRWVLVTANGGENLLLGNYRGADGVSPFPTTETRALGHEFVRRYMKEHPAGMTSKAEFVADQDRFMRQEAVRYMREHPGNALRLLGTKFLWTWSDRELPNNADVDWKARRSWLFRPPVLLLGFGLVFTLAVLGVLLLRRHEHSLLLWIPVLLAVGTCTVFLTNGRFRLPMTISLLLLAAFGLGSLASRLGDRWRSTGRRVLALTSIGVALLLAYGNLTGDRDYHHHEFDRNTAVLLFREQRYADAIPYFERSVREDPEHRDFGPLILALDLENRCDEALFAACEGLATVPGDRDPNLRRIIHDFLAWHGIGAEVALEYERASGGEGRRAVVNRVASEMRPHPSPHPFSGRMRWTE